jgi:hypothetical protein
MIEPEIKTLTIAEALPDASEADIAKIRGLFPDLACPYQPYQGWVIVQDRTVAAKTGGGVLLSDLTIAMGKQQQTIARVVAIGDLAGWDDLSAGYLPGWPWFHLGSFVKLSPHGAQRWDVEGDGGEHAVFRAAHFKDIIGGIKSARDVLR